MPSYRNTLPARTSKRAIIAWCIYDWANSAFPVIVLTFVFADFFTEKIAANRIMGMSQWADAVAIAGVFIALFSPVVGAIADHEGRRKPWLAVFSLITIVSAGLLWFSHASPDSATWTLAWVALGLVGLEVGVVFYNAMLRDVAPKNHIGRVSGWGLGVGYFGGLVSLVITLFVFVKASHAWLDTSTYEQVRICGPFVAVWFALFSLPLFFFTPDRPSTGLSFRVAMRLGLLELLKTLRNLKQHREILKFLAARIFYIDGLNTIFAFGGIYAAGVFGLTFSQVIEFGIAMNVAAGLGAIGFAWVDDYVGAKPTILMTLLIMLCAGMGILVVRTQLEFWILGMVLSVCVGPVQAASRSLMVRLVPPPLMTEMFGLYAFSGKATSFFGPWLVGILTLSFSSQRVGMSAAMALLLVGGVALCFVKAPKNR